MSVALLAFWAGGIAHANDTSQFACEPYKIPIASTITACDNGMMGSKFRTMTKECPSGAVIESREFDTSNCTAPAPAPGAVNSINKCAVNPDACAPAISTSNCPSDSYWTLKGSGIAHCVKNDPVCPWGTSLAHDFLGNPSCEANTCPSGQVLQTDGKSCACPGTTVWNGSSCVQPAPTCQESDVIAPGYVLDCPEGSGYRYGRRATTCPAGAYGEPSTSFYWDISECEDAAPTPTPTPTCSAGTETEWAYCPYKGAMWRYHTTSCPGGTYGSPSTSTSGWDTSQCEDEPTGSSPPPTAPEPEPTTPPPPVGDPPVQEPQCQDYNVSSQTSCGSGYTGQMTVTTYYWCPDGRQTVETDDSGCGCANGASDFPTCTPPPPPVTVTCGAWVKTGPFGKGTCYSETMDWEETYERSCSDGSKEYDSQWVNQGPCSS